MLGTYAGGCDGTCNRAMVRTMVRVYRAMVGARVRALV